MRDRGIPAIWLHNTAFTFIDGDDVRVAERRHDLDLPPDVDQILLVLDLLLTDGLYGHLKDENTISIWS